MKLAASFLLPLPLYSANFGKEHSGREEQAEELLRLLQGALALARPRHHALEIVDCAAGRNGGIVPTEPLQQLAAAGAEAAQIGVGGIDGAGLGGVRECDVGIEVEVAEIEARILEDYVGEELVPEEGLDGWRSSDGKWPGDPRGPAARRGFRTSLEAWKKDLAGARIPRARVDLPHGFHLGSGKAAVVVGAPALDRRRIEQALARVVEQAVLDPVQLVALLECGSLDGSELRRWNGAGRVGEDRKS